MRFARVLLSGIACLCLLLLAGAPAEAQMRTGTVMGKVTTPEGQPAIGAKITIKSHRTGREYVVKTDKHGEYIRSGLRPGRYDISVEYNEFSGKRENVPVQGGLYGNPAATEFTNQHDFDLSEIVAQRQEAGEEQEQVDEAKSGFERARALNQAGKHQEAVDELLPVLERDPSKWVAHAELAVAYASLNRTKDAINEYMTAIELNPTHPALYNNLGQLYMQLGRTDEAREQFEIAAELSGETGYKFYYNLAVTFYNNNDMKSAIEPLRKVLELQPDHANAHFFLGVCLYATAETKNEGGEIKTILPPGTREHFERYLELQPNGPHADNARAYLQAIEATVPSAVRVN